MSDAPASDLSATGWVQIVKGSFSMGSPATEPCRDTDEDEHLVTLSHDFEMQSTEVTQEQFATLMSYNPSYFGPNGSGTPCGTDCPVESVTWHEAAAYCNALSTRDGKAQCYACSGSGATVTCGEAQAHSGQNIYECPGYRLPTEAEWEYAYRAGTTTAFYSGVKDDRCPSCPLADANAEPIGWYCANSGNTTHPVGKKRANAWGLYDMAGNVWEWCNDWYQSSLGFAAVRDPWGVTAANNRTLRGGSWGGAALEVIERNRPQASPPDPEDHRVDRRASCSPMATWQDCA